MVLGDIGDKVCDVLKPDGSKVGNLVEIKRECFVIHWVRDNKVKKALTLHGCMALHPNCRSQ